MNKNIFLVSFLCTIFSITSLSLAAKTYSDDHFKTVPVEVIKDKIRGGMLGQILGNLNGLSHEMKYINEPGEVKNYLPWLPEGAITDDDTDFEWVYIWEMQKNRNVYLPYDYITALWKERINQRIWSSNRYVRHLMDFGMVPPYTGYTLFNPWAEFNVSGQFLSETFGLLAPGMPQTASKIGLNYTTVAINNEPAQTTQFFTTMIAAAFFENKIDKLLDAGIAALDEKSIIRQITGDIKKWVVQYPDNWRVTRQLLRDKYTQEEGKTRDRNGYELNTGAIVAALLYGHGDFAETLKLAFNFGWDADCNAATAGTIVGVIYGYRKMLNHNDRYNPEWQIVDRYKNTTRDNMPMDETITSFCDRLIELFEIINEDNGGKKTVENNMMVYKIPIENPIPVIKNVSTDDRKRSLIKEFEAEIKEHLINGNREERAKAAYMAICLDLDETFTKSNSKEWEEACFDLSGYWKVMNNLFFGDFSALRNLRMKFKKIGFREPVTRYSDDKLYNDNEVWKDPEFLY